MLSANGFAQHHPIPSGRYHRAHSPRHIPQVAPRATLKYSSIDFVDIFITRHSSSELGSALADVQHSSLFTLHSSLKEIAADGGPTKNQFLMQFQADMLDTPVVCTEVDDASALGAVIMNGFARGLWKSFDEVVGFRKVTQTYEPTANSQKLTALYEGWRNAVNQLIK